MKLLKGITNFLQDTFYYLIAVPILFVVNKVVLGYKLIGKENIKKVPGAKITISNHVHTIDCSMNGIVNFPQYCYFITLQSNVDLPFIGKLVRLLRGIPIPLKISEKEKFYEEISNLLKMVKQCIYIQKECLDHMLQIYYSLKKVLLQWRWKTMCQ